MGAVVISREEAERKKLGQSNISPCLGAICNLLEPNLKFKPLNRIITLNKLEWNLVWAWLNSVGAGGAILKIWQLEIK